MTAAAGVLSGSAPEMRPVVRIIGFMLLALAGVVGGAIPFARRSRHRA